MDKEMESKENSDENILVVDHLVKTYGDVKAVDDISFTVKKGSLFAFLGLNGAGKSTTINIITTILRKDSGTVLVDGYDVERKAYNVKERIGIVFQNSTLDNLLTPRENLSIRAQFYGMKGKEWEERFDTLVQLLDLSSFVDRQVGKLSGGQRRRVDIARAMVHNPKILILDEPTTGLDPQTRIGVWDLVNQLREETGMTVFLTTHYMEEAEKATDVVIMDKGRIIAHGTPTELKNRYAGDYLIIYSEKSEDIDSKLVGDGAKYTYNNDGRYYRIQVSSSKEAIDKIVQYRDFIEDFEVQKGNMDDVFLNVTGVRKLQETVEND